MMTMDFDGSFQIGDFKRLAEIHSGEFPFDRSCVERTMAWALLELLPDNGINESMHLLHTIFEFQRQGIIYGIIGCGLKK